MTQIIPQRDKGIVFYGDDAAEHTYTDATGAAKNAVAITTSYQAGATQFIGLSSTCKVPIHVEWKGTAGRKFTVKVQEQYVDVLNPTINPAWGWADVQTSLQSTGAAGLPEETAIEHVISAPANGTLVLDALLITPNTIASGAVRVMVKADGALAAGDLFRAAMTVA